MPLVMQSPLGGREELPGLTLSTAVRSSSCKAVGNGWARLGSGGQTVNLKGDTHGQDVYSQSQEVSRLRAALCGIEMHISSQLPDFKARPGWRLFRASHLGPASSRRKSLHWLFREVG